MFQRPAPPLAAAALVFALAFGLSSCGFKLRGSFTMPPDFAEVSIKGGSEGLRTQLARYLKRSGGSVAERGAGLPIIIFTRADFGRKVSTTDDDGIATGYDYEYIVEFEVEDAAGDTLLTDERVTQNRSLEYEAGDELEVESEEEFLKEEMEKELVLEIMRRLVRL